MKFSLPLALTTFLLFLGQAYAAPFTIKYLLVTKHMRMLEIVDMNNTVVKTYPVMLGRSSGPKVQEGDNKTPEGKYTLDWQNPNSKYYKSLHLSYPNKKDIKRAAKLGVNPGSDIMLHGYPNNLAEISDWIREMNMEKFPAEAVYMALPYANWTNGCIAVTNEQMEEIYSMVKVPTTIYVVP